MRLIARFAVAVLVVAASIGVGVVPARAAVEVSLPTLADLHSVEQNYVATFNGEPGIVCQYVVASSTRVHGTCHDLVTAQDPQLNIDLVAGRVIEFVDYDGKSYSRVNDEQTWTATDIENYDPNLTLNTLLFGSYIAPRETTITDIGATAVNGTAVTQYQFWSTNAELNAASGGQYVYDVFVSAQKYVLKDQESLRGSFSLGTGEIDNIWTYSNFNAEFSVSPPPAESVKAASLSSKGGWRVTSLRGIRW